MHSFDCKVVHGQVKWGFPALVARVGIGAVLNEQPHRSHIDGGHHQGGEALVVHGIDRCP